MYKFVANLFHLLVSYGYFEGVKKIKIFLSFVQVNGIKNITNTLIMDYKLV